MSDNILPYTHWAYFPSEESARTCAEDLPDYVTKVDHPLRERDLEYAEENPGTGTEWLLRAGRDVPVGGLLQRHDEVEAIVTKHGGIYDGGEATYLATEEGLTSVPDPALDNPDDPRGNP